MKLQDCLPGTRVVIGMRFLDMGLGGCAATVIAAESAGRCAERVRRQHEEDWDGLPVLYENGMVQIRLDDNVAWPCREPYIDAADLAPMPSWGSG